MATSNLQTHESSGAPTCCPTVEAAIEPERAIQLAELYKAVADPIRIRLLSLVAASGELCACDLPDLFDRSQPTMSHHLSILTSAGLIEREKRGKWAWFSIDQDRRDDVDRLLGFHS